MKTKIIFFMSFSMTCAYMHSADTQNPVTIIHTQFNRINPDRKAKTLRALLAQVPNDEKKISLAALMLKQAVTKMVANQHHDDDMNTDDNYIACEYVALSSADKHELEQVQKIIHAALSANHASDSSPARKYVTPHFNHTHRDEDDKTTFCTIL